MLPVSYDLGGNWSIASTPEVDLLLDGSGTGRHAAAIDVIGLGRALDNGLSLGVELWTEQNFDPSGTLSQYSFDLSAAWQPAGFSDLQFDGGINLGLNGDTPGFPGICRLFSTRLTPASRPDRPVLSISNVERVGEARNGQAVCGEFGARPLVGEAAPALRSCTGGVAPAQDRGKSDAPWTGRSLRWFRPHHRRRAMNMTADDAQDGGVAGHDPCERRGPVGVLRLHPADPGAERRVMHGDDRRPAVFGEPGLYPGKTVLAETGLGRAWRHGVENQKA